MAFILWLLIFGLASVDKDEVKKKWNAFCERHLIADDPYQEEPGPWGNHPPGWDPEYEFKDWPVDRD